MSVNDSDSSEVAALRYDETAIAADLARWCDGTVVEIDGQECIRLPVLAEHHIAYPGDWIVRRGESDFLVMSPDEFAVRMEARPADDPLE